MSRLGPATAALCVGLWGLACSAPSSEPEPAGSSSASDETSPPPGTSDGTASPVGTTAVGTTAAEDEGPQTIGIQEPQLCPPGVEAALEMGLGDGEFVPLDIAGAAPLIHGHQGGYHVVIGLRGVGLDLADWGAGHMRATIDGQQVADHDSVIPFKCDEGGEFSEALWLNVIFDVGPTELTGRTATVEAEFIDASDQVVVVVDDVRISESITGE